MGPGLSRAKMTALVVGSLLIVPVLSGMNLGQRIWMVRVTDMASYAQVLRAGVYSDLAWVVLTPTLLTVLFIVLYLRGRQEVRVS